MFYKEIFVERFNQLLEEQHVSKQALADALGISRPAISQIASGNNIPSLENFVAITDFFFISADYLLGRSNESHFTANIEKAELELLGKLPEHLHRQYIYAKNDLPTDYLADIIRSFQKFENDKSLSGIETAQRKLKKILSKDFYEAIIRYFFQKI